MKNINRYIIAAITLLIVGYLMWYFSDIVAYVLVAWVLSMVGQPLMSFLKKIKIGQFQLGPSARAIITLICYFVGFGLLLGLFVPLVVQQTQNLTGVDYNAIAIALEEPINQMNNWLVEQGLIQAGNSPVDQVQKTLQGRFDPSKIAEGFSSLLGIAGNLLIAVFSITFITFFFLKESRLFVDFLKAVVPSRYEHQVVNAVENSSKMLTRYFSGVLFQITIITILVTLALTILGVPNALLIGFFAALINVIPYVGPIIGALFGVFITISSNLDLEFYNEMLPLLSKVVIVFVCMQMIDNFLLQPFIFSNSVSAHPLEIFIVILIGSKLGGIVGMVLAIPTYTVFRVIARIFLSEFEIVQKLTGNMDNVS